MLTFAYPRFQIARATADLQRAVIFPAAVTSLNITSIRPPIRMITTALTNCRVSQLMPLFS